MQKYISEFIGTFVLLVSIVGSGIAGQQYTNDQMVILLSKVGGKNIVAFNVGIYITAAIIFTSSASFANPAVSIARIFTEGKYDVSRIISLCGSEVSKPRYYRTISGSCVAYLLSDNVKRENNIKKTL